MSTATEIGKKFGKSVNDFSKTSDDVLEAICMQWCNEGIEIMSKIIKSKARTKGASTLAASMHVVPHGGGKVSIQTNQIYYDFVDKGVKGVMNGTKSPQSPYSFKTIGAGTDMINSFKDYIARTGMKSIKNFSTGKRQNLILKNKKKQVDRITQAATSLAVATKIGGIKPMNFIAPAISDDRKKLLMKNIKEALGVAIKLNITHS